MKEVCTWREYNQVRSEVLTMVKISLLVFCPEDGGSIFPRNIGIRPQVHVALLPQRITST
jgi:hypothetical protein